LGVFCGVENIGLHGESIGLACTQQGKYSDVTGNINHDDWSLPCESQSGQNHEKTTKFTQALHKYYTSFEKDGCLYTTALPEDLATIVKAWPDLPAHVKECIITLVKTTNKIH